MKALDAYACAALQGLLVSDETNNWEWEEVAATAWSLALAMNSRHRELDDAGSLPGVEAPPSRDQLALAAMQGMLADESGGRDGVYLHAALAQRAYSVADAMLAARAAKPCACMASHAGPCESAKVTP